MICWIIGTEINRYLVLGFMLIWLGVACQFLMFAIALSAKDLKFLNFPVFVSAIVFEFP